MIFTSCELVEGLISFATLVASINRESSQPESGPSVVRVLFFVFFFFINSFGTVIKNHLPRQEMLETQVRSLGREDPLEKGMATHSSVLAWRIHAQRSLAGYSPWGHRVEHD